MPLVEHLRELRNRLAKALLFITVGIVVAFFFWRPILDFLREPYCRSVADGQCGLYAFGPLEAFAIQLKVSASPASSLTSPLWLYQLGAFITPALHKKERRYAAAFLVAGTVLFAAGCAVAYLTLDKGLQFLLNVGGDGVVASGLKSYLNFVTLTLLAFGVGVPVPRRSRLPQRRRACCRPAAAGLAARHDRRHRRGRRRADALDRPVHVPGMAVPLYVLYELVHPHRPGPRAARQRKRRSERPGRRARRRHRRLRRPEPPAPPAPPRRALSRAVET